MKRTFLPFFLVFVMVFSFTACGDSNEHVGEVQTPSAAKQFKGEQYLDVLSDFESAGFINVKVNKLDDLITGWMTKEGEVEKVSVGTNEDFSSGEWVANDIAVVITYHTFPEQKDSSEPPKDESSESKSEDNSSVSIDESENVEALTIDNCDDLKNLLLLKNTSDISITEFASKYKGRVIEFDGHIASMDNHESAKTRYDILIYAGDYSESELFGPHFKFEDVGVYDLGIKDLYLPDFVSINHNIRIIAEVEEFNSLAELFILNPISITDREYNTKSLESKIKSSEEAPVASSNLPDNSSKPETPSATQPETSVAQDNERIVYWADTGTKIHTSSSCRTIKGNVNSGSEEEAIAAGRTEGYCKVCG